MAIYEYRCQACQHEMEAIQKMTDEALTQCPKCGKNKLIKLISLSSFRLKGGGWYETDFKKPASSTPDKAEGLSENKPSTAENKTTTAATETSAATTTSGTTTNAAASTETA